MDRIPKQDQLILQQLQRLFEQADHLFGQLSNVTEHEFLDYHNSDCSLNHCVRWGLTAANELLEAQQLEPLSQDPWEEDPYWPREDWRNDVANGDTSLGYLDWVAHQKETAEEDEDDLYDRIAADEYECDGCGHPFHSDLLTETEQGTYCKKCLPKTDE